MRTIPIHKYIICYHDHTNEYMEEHDVEFVNPAMVGDRISKYVGDKEYKVFQIVHRTESDTTELHVKPAD